MAKDIKISIRNLYKIFGPTLKKIRIRQHRKARRTTFGITQGY